jgi:hypothetical protein
MSSNVPSTSSKAYTRDKTGSAKWAKGVSYKVVSKVLKEFKNATERFEIDRLAHTLTQALSVHGRLITLAEHDARLRKLEEKMKERP